MDLNQSQGRFALFEWRCAPSLTPLQIHGGLRLGSDAGERDSCKFSHGPEQSPEQVVIRIGCSAIEGNVVAFQGSGMIALLQRWGDQNPAVVESCGGRGSGRMTVGLITTVR